MPNQNKMSTCAHCLVFKCRQDHMHNHEKKCKNKPDIRKFLKASNKKKDPHKDGETPNSATTATRSQEDVLVEDHEVNNQILIASGVQKESINESVDNNCQTNISQETSQDGERPNSADSHQEDEAVNDNAVNKDLNSDILHLSSSSKRKRENNDTNKNNTKPVKENSINKKSQDSETPDSAPILQDNKKLKFDSKVSDMTAQDLFVLFQQQFNESLNLSTSAKVLNEPHNSRLSLNKFVENGNGWKKFGEFYYCLKCFCEKDLDGYGEDDFKRMVGFKGVIKIDLLKKRHQEHLKRHTTNFHTEISDKDMKANHLKLTVSLFISQTGTGREDFTGLLSFMSNHGLIHTNINTSWRTHYFNLAVLKNIVQKKFKHKLRGQICQVSADKMTCFRRNYQIICIQSLRQGCNDSCRPGISRDPLRVHKITNDNHGRKTPIS
jgi:hypothetical protein